ncbi:hypothetical protein VNO80_00090 [Phaseolus coccineus]|uniref:Pentatricopeptide repeat-containing protein n=1 Tax=Phaseolus coccineus TaxID=3886 RepID=A0AAN9RLX0_PHACN
MKPDRISYNTVIYAYCRNGRMKDALRIFSEMKDSALLPDVVTFNTFIATYAADSLFAEAIDVVRYMIKQGCKPDQNTYNSIVDWYCKLNRRDEANSFVKSLRDLDPHVSKEEESRLLERILFLSATPINAISNSAGYTWLELPPLTAIKHQESKTVGADVNWGLRFKDIKDGRTFTLKIKKRRKSADEPAKFKGCGDCENLCHSVMMSRRFEVLVCKFLDLKVQKLLNKVALHALVPSFDNGGDFRRGIGDLGSDVSSIVDEFSLLEDMCDLSESSSLTSSEEQLDCDQFSGWSCPVVGQQNQLSALRFLKIAALNNSIQNSCHHENSGSDSHELCDKRDATDHLVKSSHEEVIESPV